MVGKCVCRLFNVKMCWCCFFFFFVCFVGPGFIEFNSNFLQQKPYFIEYLWHDKFIQNHFSTRQNRFVQNGLTYFKSLFYTFCTMCAGWAVIEYVWMKSAWKYANHLKSSTKCCSRFSMYHFQSASKCQHLDDTVNACASLNAMWLIPNFMHWFCKAAQLCTLENAKID